VPGLHRAAAFIRLVHPFPSILDAIVTGLLALIAGASVAVAWRLAAAMLLIQFGIGALNDRADAGRDLGRVHKPIASGMVGPTAALVIAGVAFAVGLVLAAGVSVAAFAVALAGGTVGIVYDVFLKGTAWSWLGFAVGLPLLPVFAWVGATGGLPGPIVVAALCAVPAGFSLAVANALPDVERDRAARVDSVATALGAPFAWRLGVLADGVVVGAAGSSFVAFGGAGSSIGGLALIGLAGSAVIVALGLLLSRGASTRSRQRGWELQTIATGLLAAAWTAGLAAAGRI
jgi:4-hydroxybenzoate polyprenyltransferase